MARNADRSAPAVSIENLVAGFRVTGQEPLVEGDGFLGGVDFFSPSLRILKRTAPLMSKNFEIFR